MSDRSGLKSWLGYRPEQENGEAQSPDLGARIRELEGELAALRAKREFTELSEAELETLAGETAVTILKAAHSREATAKATGEEIVANANAEAAALISAAQKQAAETKSSAEKIAAALVSNANKDAETLVRNATDESNSLRNAAREEVRRHKAWLAANVKEALKLQNIQTQALATVTKNIETWQTNVNSAVGQLAAHQQSLDVEIAKDDAQDQK